MSDEETFKRQLDIIKPAELTFPITIIGAGGIGSWTTFALAKMGAHSLTIIDFDNVEDHNTPSQLYSPDHIGQSKVDALQVIIKTFTHTPIISFNGKVQEYAAMNLPFGDVVICAVDSLEERKKIWNIVRMSLGNVDLYIDARMGGEQLRILCATPADQESVKKYQKEMDSTTPADPEPCTARAVVYNTFVIGGFIASIVRKYAKQEKIDTDYMFDCALLERN
jgi:molybdopterin/thiamine biosynthesis adenylyltransferase